MFFLSEPMQTQGQICKLHTERPFALTQGFDPRTSGYLLSIDRTVTDFTEISPDLAFTKTLLRLLLFQYGGGILADSVRDPRKM